MVAIFYIHIYLTCYYTSYFFLLWLLSLHPKHFLRQNSSSRRCIHIFCNQEIWNKFRLCVHRHIHTSWFVHQRNPPTSVGVKAWLILTFKCNFAWFMRHCYSVEKYEWNSFSSIISPSKVIDNEKLIHMNVQLSFRKDRKKELQHLKNFPGHYKNIKYFKNSWKMKRRQTFYRYCIFFSQIVVIVIRICVPDSKCLRARTITRTFSNISS